MDFAEKIEKCIAVIKKAPAAGAAFTGAGISVESGIPPFRGAGGLWNKVDPSFIELSRFQREPEACWSKIRELFYNHWDKAEPNRAHILLAEMVRAGYIKGIITQNIDCLHQRAGINHDLVHEFHGTLDALVCLKCSAQYKPERELIEQNLPTCPKCGGVLKPDFVFFSEGIPQEAFECSFQLAMNCSWMLVIGTTGEIMPACEIPRQAKLHGATIIEINPEPSALTGSMTDIYLPGKASVVMDAIAKGLDF